VRRLLGSPSYSIAQNKAKCLVLTLYAYLPNLSKHGLVTRGFPDGLAFFISLFPENEQQAAVSARYSLVAAAAYALVEDQL